MSGGNYTAEAEAIDCAIARYWNTPKDDFEIAERLGIPAKVVRRRRLWLDGHRDDDAFNEREG